MSQPALGKMWSALHAMARSAARHSPPKCDFQVSIAAQVQEKPAWLNTKTTEINPAGVNEPSATDFPAVGVDINRISLIEKSWQPPLPPPARRTLKRSPGFSLRNSLSCGPFHCAGYFKTRLAIS
jgi:hypothetical protein